MVIVLAALSMLIAAFCLYGRYQFRKMEKQYPPNGQFVTVEGITLDYVSKGEGRPVVFLHGGVLTGNDFRESIDLAASAGFHGIAFDRPGYGHSERPIGEPVTPRTQARLPHEALGAYREATLAYWLRPSQFRANREDVLAFVPGVRAIMDRYSEINVPLVIAVGADGPFPTREHSFRLHEQVPDSKLLVLPGVAHMIPQPAGQIRMNTTDLYECENGRELDRSFGSGYHLKQQE